MDSLSLSLSLSLLFFSLNSLSSTKSSPLPSIFSFPKSQWHHNLTRISCGWTQKPNLTTEHLQSPSSLALQPTPGLIPQELSQHRDTNMKTSAKLKGHVGFSDDAGFFSGNPFRSHDINTLGWLDKLKDFIWAIQGTPWVQISHTTEWYSTYRLETPYIQD